MARDSAATILNHLPAVAYLVTAEPPWRLTYTSPAPSDLPSFRDVVESAAGGWEALIHPDEREDARAALGRAIRAGRNFSMTHRLPPPAETSWVLNRAEPVVDIAGEVESMVGLIVNVSGDQRAWQALKNRESHFRAFVDLTAEAHWAADAEGNLIESGERWLRQMGNPTNPCAHWKDSLHEDDRSRVEAGWQDSIASGEPYHERYRLRLPSGAYRWFRARAAPLRGADGRILKWYGTLEDVHEAEVARQELQCTQQRYALAARATGDIIWEWEVADDVIRRMADPALLASLGLPADGDSGSWMDRIHRADLDRVRSGVCAIAQGKGDTWSAEYRLRRPSGDYAHLLDRAFLVRDAQGRPERLVGAMQDVTAHKLRESDLRELQLELVNMAQVNAAATMATNLAHELNQPLTACTNYLAQVRMVLERLDGDAPREALATAARAEDQVLRAGQAIRRIRALERDSRPGDGGVPFGEVVEWVTRLMQASNVCPDAVLHTHLSGRDALLAADRLQIAQVMLNLVAEICAVNARPSPEVTISSQILDGSAEVEISTVGPVDDNRVERALSALARAVSMNTDRLSVARTIVETQGGRLWAERGSVRSLSFHFTVPLESGDGRGGEPGRIDAPRASLGPSKRRPWRRGSTVVS